MMFWQFSENFRNQIALVFQGKRYSYGDLQELCDTATRQLPEPRSLIFLLCRNDLSTVVAYLACLQKQVVAMLLDANTLPQNLTRLADIYQPHAIFSGGKLQQTGHLAYLVDKRLALLMSTSGSTGTAKQVALSYRNLQANAVSICGFLPIESSDVTLTTLPCYYSYGLSVLNTHLLKGACTVVSDESAVSRQFWRNLQDERVTSFAGVPYTYEMLFKLGFLRNEYPHLRYLTQAGGRLADTLVIAFAKTLQAQGKRFYVMYGQTEATARMAWLSPDRLPEKADAIGQAIPGGVFSLIDNEGRKINRGEGELVYRGPNIMLGYANSREDLSEFHPNEILNTGDIARQDEEGDYHIIGRLKRFVKIFGLRINLDEVEQLLDAAGFTAKVTGSDSMIYIALTKLNQESVVKDLMSKTLKLHPSTFKIRYIPQFPLNANKKTDYQALTNWFKEGRQGV